MKDVFIILTQSGTGVSKFLKYLSKEKYNHSSIALDKDLSEFYSFGRKVINNPLNGGFVIEHKDKGVFKKFSNTPCLILKLTISDNKFIHLKEVIDSFIENKDVYKYAFINLALIDTKFHTNTDTRFFCSEFVAYVLNTIGIKTPVSSEHIHPIDFLKLPNSEIIYEGILQKY